jgi:DNA-binding MarR family transcriptional regulator
MKTKPAGSVARFDSIEQEAFLNLWRTYDRLRALEDALFSRYDLTPQQYNVLRLLRASHPEAVRTLALADRLVSRAPDITRMLDKLEECKLIARHRPADNRRVVRVHITAEGIALLDKIAGPLRACHEEQLGHLGAADLKQLIRLLHAARLPHEDGASPWR